MLSKNVLRSLLLFVLLAALPAWAQRYAYIARSAGNAVSVVDIQTNTVVANIGVGTTPWGVAATPDGKRVYVPNNGSNNVSVIDTATNTVITTVAVGNGPYHAAVSPDGSEVYVPNYGTGSLSIISTATNTVVATIGGMPSANGIVFSPKGDFAYVSGYGNGRIYKVDTAARTATFVSGSTSAEGMAISPDGRKVYLGSTGSNNITIYDTVTNAVSTLGVGGGSWDVAVHPNGRFFYVSVNTRYVNVYRTSDNVLATQIDLGNNTQPTGINLTPSGNFAYVGRRNNTAMSVINTVNNSATTLTLPGNSYGMGTAIAEPLFGHGDIAAGQYHACRIRGGTRTLDCWGRNGDGQATAPSGAFFQVVAGSAHTCGLKTDGTVSCWGNNAYGQATPAAAGANPYQVLASGARHVCGLRTDSSILCWGENDQGQATVPAGTNNFQGLATGSSHSCGLRSTGAITCWGRNANGQTTVPAAGTGLTYIQVIAGASFTCGLRSNRTAVCWGDNTDGKATAASGVFSRLYAQSSYACGVRFDGSVVCWGADAQGETMPPSGAMPAISLGRQFACGLRPLGLLDCWGWNKYNQAPQFELSPVTLHNGTVGIGYSVEVLSLDVANPGDSDPYAPRTPVIGLLSGTLPPGLSILAGNVLSGTPTTPGTYNFTLQGEDANGFYAQRAYTIIIGGSDATPPVITKTVQGLAGTNGWYRSDVTVVWTVEDPESLITSQIGCGTQTFATETAADLSGCQATSAGGTSFDAVAIKLDKTAPVLVPTVSNKRPLLNEVITADAGASDALSGIASQSCETPATDVVSADAMRITCTATDEAGNTASRKLAYQVIYGFSGFTGDVYNPGWWNQAGLGQAITFAYRVTDANGNGVAGLSAPSFSSASMACPAKIKSVVAAAAAAPGLVDLGDGYYEFTWVSPASADCARLTINLGDGDTVKRVQFKFE